MYPPQPSACMPQENRNFSHAKSLSACSVLPPPCRQYYHPPAYSTIAMVLCMSMPLALYGTLAVLGDPAEASRASSGKKRLARSLPPTLSPIRPGASCRHASFDAAQRELRPRYKSLAQGTCEFRSDSLGSIVITLKSAALLELKIGRSCLLRVWVCALFPRLMPVCACAACSLVPCHFFSACSCMTVAAAGIRRPLVVFGWGLIDILHLPDESVNPQRQ